MFAPHLVALAIITIERQFEKMDTLEQPGCEILKIVN
jgi:hypothetical protein